MLLSQKTQRVKGAGIAAQETMKNTPEKWGSALTLMTRPSSLSVRPVKPGAEEMHHTPFSMGNVVWQLPRSAWEPQGVAEHLVNHECPPAMNPPRAILAPREVKNSVQKTSALLTLPLPAVDALLRNLLAHPLHHPDQEEGLIKPHGYAAPMKIPAQALRIRTTGPSLTSAKWSGPCALAPTPLAGAPCASSTFAGGMRQQPL